MKDHPLSTTSVTAMLESWKQNDVVFPNVVDTYTKVVRLLTMLEKAQFTSHYDGDLSQPWFAFFLNDEMVALCDSLPMLLAGMKKAGYKIRNLDMLV